MHQMVQSGPVSLELEPRAEKAQPVGKCGLLVLAEGIGRWRSKCPASPSAHQSILLQPLCAAENRESAKRPPLAVSAILKLTPPGASPARRPSTAAVAAGSCGML